MDTKDSPYASFMSVPNYQHLMRVLNKYSDEKNLDPVKNGVRLNRLVYKTMVDVDEEYSTEGPVMKNKRTVEIVAAFLNNVVSTVRSQYVLREKEEPCMDPPITDTPIDDMQRRLDILNQTRIDVDIGDPYLQYTDAVQDSLDKTGSAASVLRPDLVGLRTNIGKVCDDPNAEAGILADELPGAGGAGGITGDLSQLSQSNPKRLVQKYLMINGYDRNVNTFPSRYRFGINLVQTDSDFKDVREITATRLIIPREIIQERTITNVPKTNFEYPFGLPFPYLVLKIDDFQNIYKGSNNTSQTAFCHFIYDTSYTSSNGRGFLHLKPMQNESLTFDINPLARLSQMTLSILRPGGELLNESRDNVNVLRLDWNNMVNSNQQLIMVTLKRFYDRNEYYTGDNIRFFNFEIPGATSAINGFINRESGHDIIEFGCPNVDGYIESFYIRVPGILNVDTGLFDTDVPAVTELMDYINGLDYENNPPSSLAVIVNSTLQASVSFTLQVEQDNVTM